MPHAMRKPTTRSNPTCKPADPVAEFPKKLETPETRFKSLLNRVCPPRAAHSTQNPTMSRKTQRNPAKSRKAQQSPARFQQNSATGNSGHRNVEGQARCGGASGELSWGARVGRATWHGPLGRGFMMDAWCGGDAWRVKGAVVELHPPASGCAS